MFSHKAKKSGWRKKWNEKKKEIIHKEVALQIKYIHFCFLSERGIKLKLIQVKHQLDEKKIWHSTILNDGTHFSYKGKRTTNVTFEKNGKLAAG